MPRPLGDALAVVEGDEVTVYVGKITHGHFNRFDVEAVERDRAIAEDVAAFLSNLFNDRVELWSHGSDGGWRVLEQAERPTRTGRRATFTWSGPVL